MVKQSHVPDRADIIWINLDPAKVHEQKGFRPVLVLTPKIYNAKTGLLLACPITSHAKNYQFEVPCKVSKVEGVILTNHIRSFDWQARHTKHITVAPASVMEAVEERLLALIKS